MKKLIMSLALITGVSSVDNVRQNYIASCEIIYTKCVSKKNYVFSDQNPSLEKITKAVLQESEQHNRIVNIDGEDYLQLSYVPCFSKKIRYLGPFKLSIVKKFDPTFGLLVDVLTDDGLTIYYYNTKRRSIVSSREEADIFLAKSGSKEALFAFKKIPSLPSF